VTAPLDPLTLRVKFAAFGGLVLASPIVLWELWRFITPGLRPNEKRYAVPFVVAAVVLFAMGVTTSILIFPKALTWLINVSGHNIAPLFQPQQYFMLYVVLCVIFGVVFMYPLVVVGLELTGVVPSLRWRKWRRPAIVILCVVAAVATPSSDPFSFLAMAIPMVVLYELSIVIGRVLHK
ncbi:MAG TPA: twin-arginine translocase subunit TatC, partial [Acidimicrobiales bacterium]|nr:twin-arginine translocase subunit TatC [Acidimicrobiales bacterium]